MIYYLGTSGWSYAGWRRIFYPEELPQREWLPFYAGHFNTVEINMTFYRFPKPETLLGWLERTPENFLFSLKANRQITHLKKIRGVKNEVRYFYILSDRLRHKLGCILFQLPPSLTLNIKLLQEFLSTLSPEYRNVIEFRHESWYTEEVFNLLNSYKVTFCSVSSKKVPGKLVQTSETGYLRFHGLTGGYRYDYTEEELKSWAEEIKKSNIKEWFIYFNNDYRAYAIKNSHTLKKFLESK